MTEWVIRCRSGGGGQVWEVNDTKSGKNNGPKKRGKTKEKILPVT